MREEKIQGTIFIGHNSNEILVYRFSTVLKSEMRYLHHNYIAVFSTRSRTNHVASGHYSRYLCFQACKTKSDKSTKLYGNFRAIQVPI